MPLPTKLARLDGTPLPPDAVTSQAVLFINTENRSPLYQFLVSRDSTSMERFSCAPHLMSQALTLLLGGL